MSKLKKDVPKAPAKASARHKPIADLETKARELFHIQKTFIAGGGDKAVEALKSLLTPNYDPSDASAQAHASVDIADFVFDEKEQAAKARSTGGHKTATGRRKDAMAAYQAICDEATKLLQASRTRRQVSGILVSRGMGSRTKVLKALKLHPSGYWAKARNRNAR